MAYTAQQLVQSALRKLGVADFGAQEEIDALESMNQYIQSIAADRDMWVMGLAPLTTFSSLNDTLDAPNEYANLLINQTAIYIAPEYGVKTTPEVAAAAKYSADTIRMQTFREQSKQIPHNSWPR